MSNGGEDPKELDRGIKELDRAIKELDRAIKELDRGGGAGSTVDNIVRGVTGMGGLLVVAFVAPVAGSANGAGRSRGPRNLAIEVAADKAQARVKEAAIQQQLNEAKEKVSALAQSLRQMPKLKK
jgi:hypothetical protein